MTEGCERSGSRESLKGTSRPGVQGEELVCGSPFWGLLAMMGEGHSVRSQSVLTLGVRD